MKTQKLLLITVVVASFFSTSFANEGGFSSITTGGGVRDPEEIASVSGNGALSDNTKVASGFCPKCELARYHGRLGDYTASAPVTSSVAPASGNEDGTQ
jgi:hypothetical protein